MKDRDNMEKELNDLFDAERYGETGKFVYERYHRPPGIKCMNPSCEYNDNAYYGASYPNEEDLKKHHSMGYCLNCLDDCRIAEEETY